MGNRVDSSTRQNSGWDQFWNGGAKHTSTTTGTGSRQTSRRGNNSHETHLDKNNRKTSETATRETYDSTWGRERTKTTYKNDYTYSAKGSRYGVHRTITQKPGEKETTKVHYSFRGQDGVNHTFASAAARDAFARKNGG